MTPGRFVSLWFLYLGALILLQYPLLVALGEPIDLLSLEAAWVLLPGIGALVMGVTRIMDPDHEAWPEAYGLWTYTAGLFLVVGTGWLLYLAIVELTGA